MCGAVGDDDDDWIGPPAISKVMMVRWVEQGVSM